RTDWEALERAARSCAPGADGVEVLPFAYPEPSRGVTAPRVQWFPAEPQEPGRRFRAALEALAYLVALGVREPEAAGARGTRVRRVSVSGGIARSDVMCEVLATVLGRPLERLVSSEGPALGAAVTALAALETTLRRRAGVATPFTAADAAATLVKFKAPVAPN